MVRSTTSMPGHVQSTALGPLSHPLVTLRPIADPRCRRALDADPHQECEQDENDQGFHGRTSFLLLHRSQQGHELLRRIDDSH